MARCFGDTWAALDDHAWNAICSWPQHTGTVFVNGGLDYALLTRWFLWDKVGRSMRRLADPDGFAVEAGELGWTAADGEPVGSETILPCECSVRHTLARLARRWRRAPGPAPAPIPAARGSARVFLPVPTPRTGQAAAALVEDGRVQVVAAAVSHYTTPGATLAPRIPASREPDWPFVSRLYAAIRDGLAAAGTPLLRGDAVCLQEQLITQAREVLLAEAMLDHVRPDVMLVHGDNHPPFQYHVLLGRQRGVPSVMLQHGLDCERHYLDDAYATAIAVWGTARAERYRRDSQPPPAAVAVTGNPEYDDRRLPETICLRDGYWLWVGRPHSAAKCYAPSRSPGEGITILDALLAECAKRPGQRLIVKPHPYDNTRPYEDAIAAAGLGDRVVMTGERPLDLFDGASLVFTEDSTAGLEAMFWGKPLVHVHFAPSEPTLPLVDYGAALPGRCAVTLADSIARAEMTPAATAGMLDGQRRFLRDFAGPCDGHAADRVRAFLLQQVEGQ